MRFLQIFLASLTLFCWPAKAANFNAFQDIEIPYKKYVLPNGLTLIVHQDRKAPIVAVNIWYHVGSKNERQSRTGFAHLFEHLMFNGSENFNDDFFKAIEKIGATDVNGTTSEDRTNYFENVPKDALDVILWLESDRMGHFKGAITQERLDEQRGVVQNEKRQGENQPYGLTSELMPRATYPSGHPYSWSVIGSMDDLNAASLDNVKQWFSTYYGPANAVLVLAGDIDFETAKSKVEKYFGDIPSGPPLARFSQWAAQRTGSQRQIMQDRVPQARLYKVWNIPGYRDQDTVLLELASGILAGGKNSRLYQRLVYKEQIASDVSAYVDRREIGGQFHLDVTARAGHDLAQIEKEVDEELATLLRAGPSEAELLQVQSVALSGFVRGIERIGGFGGKSDLLAQSEVMGGSPDFYKTNLKWIREAKPEQIKKAAHQWLSDGVFNLEVHPFPDFKATEANTKRSAMPEPEGSVETRFPTIERAELSNGLKIALAHRSGVPMVHFSLMVDSGYSADPAGKSGLAGLTADMLDEGTKTRNALQISKDEELLGAELDFRAGADFCGARLSALKQNLDKSLELFADLIVNPAFRESDFKRVQQLQLDAIQQEKAEPFGMASRVLPVIIYGSNHPYGAPSSGNGSEDSVRKLTREDALRFHREWFKPNNSTLIIVGDTTIEEMKVKLQKVFSEWERGQITTRTIPAILNKSESILYLMDRPDSMQSLIGAGIATVPSNNPDEIAIQCMNNILGGEFTSRLNMNLREDKHWAYGAGSFVADARGQRLFMAYAPVQTDKTKEAILEMMKELKGIVDDKPVVKAELDRTQRQMTLEMAGRWETLRSLSRSVSQLVYFGLPDDFYQTYASNVRGLTLDYVSKASRMVIQPEKMVWVVVGDKAKIEPGLRELGFKTIRYLDKDGKALD